MRGDFWIIDAATDMLSGRFWIMGTVIHGELEFDVSVTPALGLVASASTGLSLEPHMSSGLTLTPSHKGGG